MRVNQQVLGLQISVQDTMRVAVVEAVEQLLGELLIGRKGTQGFSTGREGGK